MGMDKIVVPANTGSHVLFQMGHYRWMDKDNPNASRSTLRPDGPVVVDSHGIERYCLDNLQIVIYEDGEIRAERREIW